jgi:hypothetical protein
MLRYTYIATLSSMLHVLGTKKTAYSDKTLRRPEHPLTQSRPVRFYKYVHTVVTWKTVSPVCVHFNMTLITIFYIHVTVRRYRFFY